MTCKDCIYFNRCVVLGVELDIKHNKEADKNCRHFKNKSDFVELVHCAKCKNWVKTGYDTLLEVDFGFCYNTDFPFVCESRPITNGSSFCSYGEKK